MWTLEPWGSSCSNLQSRIVIKSRNIVQEHKTSRRIRRKLVRQELVIIIHQELIIIIIFLVHDLVPAFVCNGNCLVIKRYELRHNRFRHGLVDFIEMDHLGTVCNVVIRLRESPDFTNVFSDISGSVDWRTLLDLLHPLCSITVSVFCIGATKVTPAKRLKFIIS